MASQMTMQKYGWTANFIENHDQPRAASKYLKEAPGQSRCGEDDGGHVFLPERDAVYLSGTGTGGWLILTRTSIEQFNDISSIDQYYRSIEEGLTEDEALKIVNLRSRGQRKDAIPLGRMRNTADSLKRRRGLR